MLRISEESGNNLAMKISAKAEYACLAVLELVLRRDQVEPSRLAEIAEKDQIPGRFLVQILLQLKGAGYVQSIRGAAGGYRLAVDPDKMTVWDVIHLVDGANASGPSEDDLQRGTGWQVLHGVWQEVNRREEDYLKSISFAELAEQASRQSADMFYI